MSGANEFHSTPNTSGLVQPKAAPSHLHIRPCWQQVTQPLLPAMEESLTPAFCSFKNRTRLGGMLVGCHTLAVALNAQPLNPPHPTALDMSSLGATTHTPSPLHFSDCRTPLPACSCYTIPFPLLIPRLAHSPPLSISTIPIGQGFPSHLLPVRPDKRHPFIFPLKQFPSLPAIYLPYIFSIYCIEMAGPKCMSKSQNH